MIKTFIEYLAEAAFQHKTLNPQGTYPVGNLLDKTNWGVARDMFSDEGGDVNDILVFIRSISSNFYHLYKAASQAMTYTRANRSGYEHEGDLEGQQAIANALRLVASASLDIVKCTQAKDYQDEPLEMIRNIVRRLTFSMQNPLYPQIIYFAKNQGYIDVFSLGSRGGRNSPVDQNIKQKYKNSRKNIFIRFINLINTTYEHGKDMIKLAQSHGHTAPLDPMPDKLPNIKGKPYYDSQIPWDEDDQ